MAISNAENPMLSDLQDLLNRFSWLGVGQDIDSLSPDEIAALYRFLQRLKEQ